MPKRKGYEHERAFVNYMRDGHVVARRVPLSGAGEEKGDATVTCGWGQVLRGEGKRRASLPDWLGKALGDHDFVFLREDKGSTFVLLPLHVFRDLCQ